MTTVVSIKADQDYEHDAFDAFNSLYARYLKAEARATILLSDKAIARAGKAKANLIWELIKTPAVMRYQIGYKLVILQNLFSDGGGWVDRREWCMLASIQQDTEDLWQV